MITLKVADMKKLRDASLIISPDYLQFIEELKARVVSARITAARAITHEAILLYWDIGRGIEEKQKRYAWGESAIDQISIDLLNAFPGSTGYSPRNLRSAKQLYLAYSDPTIWLQPVAKLTAGSAIELMRQWVSEIPWGQNLLILNKITDPARWGQSSRIHIDALKPDQRTEKAGRCHRYFTVKT